MGEGVFVFVKVYGDESGTHDATGKQRGAEVTSVGGYAATPEAWAEFCGEWQTVLDKYRIESFRFSERNYPHLSHEERQRLPIELAEICTRRTMFGVAACSVPSDYHLISDRVKEVIRHPYYLAVLSYYNMAMVEAARHCQSPDDGFKYFFDANTEFADHSVTLFKWAKLVFDRQDRMRDVTHMTGNHTRIERMPLQAADLLAGRAREKLTEALLHGKTGESPLDKALGAGTHVMLARLRPDGMKQMAETIEAHLKGREQ